MSPPGKGKKGAAPKKSAPKKKTDKNAAPKTSTYVITRTSLQDAGLHERVDADHPLLTDLQRYMERSSGCKSQQYRRGVVNHVRRLHHFLQKTPENPHPTVLDPEAMTDPIKFKGFIEEFGRHTSGCGQKSLEKNLKRYLYFLQEDYNVQFHNQPLAKTVDYLMKCLAESTKATSKRIAEEMNNKAFRKMITGSQDGPTIRDVRAVIDDATLRGSVEDALSRGLRAGHIVPHSTEANTYIQCVRYLMCLLAFDHFQRPGVAQSMTVFEFDNGRWLQGRYVVGVRKHKTGASHPAVFSLRPEDHVLFARYRNDVRRPMADEAMEETDGAFFFTTLGGKCYPSVSSELDKMQRKMGVRRVSSNAARHWMETASHYSGGSTQADQDGVSDYLTHSAEVAKKVYVIPRYTDVNVAKIRMERLVREAIAKEAGDPVPAADDRRDASDPIIPAIIPATIPAAADDQPGYSGVSSGPGGVETPSNDDDDDSSSVVSGDGDAVLDALLVAFPADGEEPTDSDVRNMLPPGVTDSHMLSLLRKWRHRKIVECPPAPRVVAYQGKGKGKGKVSKRPRPDDELSQDDIHPFVKLRRLDDGHM